MTGTKQGADWVIDLREPLRKRGIENSFHLAKAIGGSNESATHLFNGSVKMIRLDTMNRLQDRLGISPYEYLINKNA